MGSLVSNCRECGAHNVSMTIRGFYVPHGTKARAGRSDFGYVMAVCSACEVPSIYHFDPKGGATWEGVINILSNALNKEVNLSSGKVQITLFEQRQSATETPAHLPEDVVKALNQAESNYGLPDHEEAAATMYRRALERAIKFAYPDISGTLAAKISKLVNAGAIPAALGDWATQVRLIGNDGAHDDEVTKEDLIAARAFCDNFLRYLITLPKQVELRKAQE